MKREYQRWYSQRLGLELGVVVYGHWGAPLLGFPTSAGDEWELEGQGMVGALGDFIDGGKIKFYAVNAINGLSFYNKGAHPFHRSHVQAMFDSYLREEVVPFIWNNCQTEGLVISTMGGVYDLRNFMDGMYDDNFYFNNPVDYLANMSDAWFYEQIATCDIHISTGTGPWENSGPSYRLSEVLSSKGIRHSLDNWGPQGGHDWPYWKHQMREYVARLF
jgi:esterase/lipase superfamily enzyme